jgi:hypothetical protein
MSHLQIDPSKVGVVAKHLSVTAVPTCVLLRGGDIVEKVEGFDPALFITKASNLVTDGKKSLNTRLKELVSKEPVMLFMKGTPNAPRCGFSARVVKALGDAGIPFASFDILSDEEVRKKQHGLPTNIE